MVVFSESELVNCIVHRVGNPAQNGTLKLSEQSVPLSEDLTEILQKFFFRPFRIDREFYKFKHSSGDVSRNDIFHYAKMLFSNPDSFTDISKNIAKHLYEQSSHPRIKSGECCVVLFDNVIIEGEPVNAAGIFKFERKDTFLKLDENEGGVSFDPKEGINVEKSDKGCIIFNTEEETGFRLLISDNNAYDAQYWPEAFLNATPDTNESYFTGKTFEAVNSFAGEMIERNDSTTGTSRMEILDRTAKYFEEKESFNVDNFVEEVIQTDSYKDKFKEYKKKFDEERHIPEQDSFEIDKQAVKKSKRKLQNTIKLDGQIQIKLNFNNESQVDHYLQKGYDSQKEMHYYKVYFREEE